MHGHISGDIAVLWSLRKSSLVGLTDDPAATSWKGLGKEFMTRGTTVYRREPEGWRLIHLHFSEASEGERPGGI